MRLENHVSQSKMRLLSEEMFCEVCERCEKKVWTLTVSGDRSLSLKKRATRIYILLIIRFEEAPDESLLHNKKSFFSNAAKKNLLEWS